MGLLFVVTPTRPPTYRNNQYHRLDWKFRESLPADTETVFSDYGYSGDIFRGFERTQGREIGIYRSAHPFVNLDCTYFSETEGAMVKEIPDEFTVSSGIMTQMPGYVYFATTGRINPRTVPLVDALKEYQERPLSSNLEEALKDEDQCWVMTKGWFFPRLRKPLAAFCAVTTPDSEYCLLFRKQEDGLALGDEAKRRIRDRHNNRYQA